MMTCLFCLLLKIVDERILEKPMFVSAVFILYYELCATVEKKHGGEWANKPG